MNITVRPLTPPRWLDFETVFQAKGCSIARCCWCMVYRQSGKQTVPPGTTASEARRRQMKALVKQGPPPGLIGYCGKLPVGWVSLGPRCDYRKLQRSPVMKPVDDQPVWSLVCFVVPSEFRHQGAAKGLLEGAINYARKQGAMILEAYPVDKAGPVSDQWLWHGTKSMYDKAGFVEIARRRPERPVMRLELCKPR
jgi:hypothetical protein